MRVFFPQPHIRRSSRTEKRRLRSDSESASEGGRLRAQRTSERSERRKGGGEKGGKKLREEIEAVIRTDESELMNENTQTDEGGGGEAMIQSCDSQAETPGDAL